ncbi:hypothetical protein A2625_01180 [candidate division WOR-1 bacterium RIFCSPHIGHO2_01_FULL_53_15]|uniref:Uncharacterized protein n=1 Tax=candidate division WOR-1 bacterium RIFCSPHIGHO2_01_FULL_53_15 TaxID=1802564 RepID=A0A1F4Q0R8_UNCSA|nr:MAG: hypothetical protein A2625_01180 [candidate division WOR-1 bacterium RIFCSPHIGHO2_01_FULL_53_15]OGC10761.1 MAG: hypothetical protein A3D23_04690 [candidate division WOR-1 bacterium RIFCSPHIGHO2_02_FULL_53_26]
MTKRLLIIIAALAVLDGVGFSAKQEFTFAPPQSTIYWQPPAGFEQGGTWSPPPEYKGEFKAWEPPPGFEKTQQPWSPPSGWQEQQDKWSPPTEWK